MGDNDFTAGDPWGLPIEESEEFEIEAALPEPAIAPAEDDVEDDLGEEVVEPPVVAEGDAFGEEVVEPPVVAEGDAFFPVHDDVEADSGATPDAAAGVGESDDESPGPAWWSSSEEADSTEGDGDTAEEWDHEPDEESQEEEEEEEEGTLATSARTPLSQMIAAAQSVVSSVQGDQVDEAEEETNSEPHDSDQAIPDEIAPPGEPEIIAAPEEPEPVAVVAPQEVTDGDDDLPEEPPSWLIMEKESDRETPEPLPSDEAREPADTFEAVDTSEEETTPSFTPADIEASIAGLAAPAEVPFSEDRFDIPGEEEPETDEGFGEVDMDSSPGVYSELHHLADQDDQAEALLSEAAEAFGRSDETSIDDLAGLPAAPEEIDSYAEALAAELEVDDTTEDVTDDLEELPEGVPAAPEEIDSYAEALAAELEVDDTTEDVTDDLEELPEGAPAAPEEIDSYAEALAAELEVDDTTEDVTDDLEELPEGVPAAPEEIDSYAEALAAELEVDDTTEDVTDDLEELPEGVPAAPEEIDSYAEALTTELEVDDTTEEVTEEEVDHEEIEGLAGAFREEAVPEAVEGFTEESTTELDVGDGLLESVTDDLEELAGDNLPAPEEIEGYAEALITDLEGDDTTEEVAEEETGVEVIDSYAEALTTEFEGDESAEDLVDEDTEIEVAEEALVDSDAAGYLSETELGDALAGLAETSTDEFGDGAVSALEEVEEVSTPDWWGEADELVATSSPPEQPASDDVIISSDEAVESSIESVWPGAEQLDADEPDLVAVDETDAAGQTEPGEEALEASGLAEASIEGAAVIDSPVEWGTRYRDSHQGWVEDDEGHSTWRPIVTSGESVAGWEIDIYLGLVSGDVATEPDSSETIAGEVAAAREVAVRRMLDEALARGAHAVVGVTFAIQDAAGMVLVSASGVAVTLRTPA